LKEGLAAQANRGEDREYRLGDYKCPDGGERDEHVCPGEKSFCDTCSDAGMKCPGYMVNIAVGMSEEDAANMCEKGLVCREADCPSLEYNNLGRILSMCIAVLLMT
jgi:hypothetical protein